jgi:hypothetical protein
MKRLLLLLLIGLSYSHFNAQVIITMGYQQYNSDTYRFQITKDATRFCDTTVHFYDYDSLILRAIPTGKHYLLTVEPIDTANAFVYQQYFDVYSDSSTLIHINVTCITNYKAILDTSLVKTRQEFILNGSLINTKVFDPNSPLTLSATIGYQQYSWLAFSKHIGWLIGGGLELSHTAFSTDTTFSYHNGVQKRYEYYNYLKGSLSTKLRFSIGNQQSKDIHPNKLFMDIGARYNIPLRMQHKTIYSNSEKLSEGKFHEFSDLRLTGALGYQNISLYAEYRCFDFIGKNLPELSKYVIGIQLHIDLY